jgi:hypothetical protein
MSQQSSLTQSAHSVRQVLTAYNEGTSSYADEVTLARKGAKSRTFATDLHSTGTRTRKPRVDLEQQLENYRRELAQAREHLAESLEQQPATAEVLSVISGSYVPPTPVALVNRVRINTLALATHMPTTLAVREYVEASKAGSMSSLRRISNVASPGESASVEAAFRQGLREQGYVEGQNLHIAFRWAEGHYDRLPALAANLAEIRVAVIVTAPAAKPRGSQQRPKPRPSRLSSTPARTR